MSIDSSPRPLDLEAYESLNKQVASEKESGNLKYSLAQFQEAEKLYTNAITLVSEFVENSSKPFEVEAGTNPLIPGSNSESCGSLEAHIDETDTGKKGLTDRTLGEESISEKTELGETDQIEKLKKKTLPMLLNNRAICHLRMENYGAAIADATRAIHCSLGANAKSYFRLGSAHFCLTQYELAARSFRMALLRAPGDRDIRIRLKEAEKLLSQQKFAEAIRSAEKSPQWQQIDLADFEPDSNYKGPSLDRGITHPELFGVTHPESFEGDAGVSKACSVVEGAEGSSLDTNLETSRETSKASSLSVEANETAKILERMKLPNIERNEKLFTELIEYFKADPENRMSQKMLVQLCLMIIGRYSKEANIVKIQVPDDEAFNLNVCGDVHGQFYDLLKIFELRGFPSNTNWFLFNGDFVDRGAFSVEIISTLYLAKLIWPESIHLTRGNHESRRMTKVYGFEGEMKHKGSSRIYDLYCESFDYLPLVNLINEKIFVVHGGIPIDPKVTLKDINAINRLHEEDEGLMSDLLWADPQEEEGFQPSKRGVSHTFGPDITRNFLQTNNLQLIIRSHELKQSGYQIEHDRNLITVFSAPNYCDQIGNDGAIIQFNGKSLNAQIREAQPLEPTIHVFSASPHPPVRSMAYANHGLMM